MLCCSAMLCCYAMPRRRCGTARVATRRRTSSSPREAAATGAGRASGSCCGELREREREWRARRMRVVAVSRVLTWWRVRSAAVGAAAVRVPRQDNDDGHAAWLGLGCAFCAAHTAAARARHAKELRALACTHRTQSVGSDGGTRGFTPFDYTATTRGQNFGTSATLALQAIAHSRTSALRSSLSTAFALATWHFAPAPAQVGPQACRGSWCRARGTVLACSCRGPFMRMVATPP
jgi:hypothetical protein